MQTSLPPLRMTNALYFFSVRVLKLNRDLLAAAPLVAELQRQDPPAALAVRRVARLQHAMHHHRLLPGQPRAVPLDHGAAGHAPARHVRESECVGKHASFWLSMK